MIKIETIKTECCVISSFQDAISMSFFLVVKQESYTINDNSKNNKNGMW